MKDPAMVAGGEHGGGGASNSHGGAVAAERHQHRLCDSTEVRQASLQAAQGHHIVVQA